MSVNQNVKRDQSFLRKSDTSSFLVVSCRRVGGRAGRELVLIVLVMIPRQAVRHLGIVTMIVNCDVENEQVLEATFVGGGCLLANKKMQKCTVSKKMKISTFSMCRRKEVMDFRMRRSTINLRIEFS